MFDDDIGAIMGSEIDDIAASSLQKQRSDIYGNK